VSLKIDKKLSLNIVKKSGFRNRKSKKAMADDEDETDGDPLLDGDAAGDSEEGEVEDACFVCHVRSRVA
jgi:hypothetical protein